MSTRGCSATAGSPTGWRPAGGAEIVIDDPAPLSPGPRGRPPSGSRAEVAQDREDAAVVGLAGGSPSLSKMLATCFSTVPPVTTSAPAMPAFERPSAISASTWRSRAGQRRQAVGAAAGPQQLADDLGVERRAAGGDPLQRVGELGDVGHPLLQQVARRPPRCPPAAGPCTWSRCTATAPAPRCAGARGGSRARPAAPRRCASAASGCRPPRRRAGARPPRPAARRRRPRRRTPGGRGPRSAGRARPEQDRVLGDHDPQPVHARSGSSTVIFVGPPGGLAIVSRPSTTRPAARARTGRCPGPGRPRRRRRRRR